MAKTSKKRTTQKHQVSGKRTTQAELEPVTIVDLTASVCPFCRSTDREPYNGTEIIKGPVSIGRTTYAKVELRRTRCTNCQRRRIDRSLVPMPDKQFPKLSELRDNSPEPGE